MARHAIVWGAGFVALVGALALGTMPSAAASQAASGARAVASSVTPSHSPDPSRLEPAHAHHRRLRITTKKLPNGVVGLSYIAVLSAKGGQQPYRWSARHLPRGLHLSQAGVLKGYPSSRGARHIALRVRDHEHHNRREVLLLRVPTALPHACRARSCSKLRRDGHTRQVPKADILGFSRGKGDEVKTVTIDNTQVHRGDVLVLAPRKGIPSGLIAVAHSVRNSHGVRLVTVRTATPADAYYRGDVQSIGTNVTAARLVDNPGTTTASTSRATLAAQSTLKCNGNVTAELHGLSITPSLKPSVTAIWKHPLFGGKGIYVGAGGLSLFQFDLDGSITVDIGASVSGQGTCTLSLPKIGAKVPAGDLGAVFLSLAPEITFKATGGVAVEDSVTLSCGAEFRWDQGSSYSGHYCAEKHEPLGLTSDSGVDATATGSIAASVSLDDLPGVVGTLKTALHAGYHPKQHPIAEIDAEVDYDLKATLANIWKKAPTLTIADGVIFQKTLATYDKPPKSGEGPLSLSVDPYVANPWSDAVCGFDTPSYGDVLNYFSYIGSGFKPNESIDMSTDWADYGTTTADQFGDADAYLPVGEVASADYTPYGVYANGASGSFAETGMELNSDVCSLQTQSVGEVTVQWGGNGFDPYSDLALSIDGTDYDTVSADQYGSGGSVDSFDCPSSGSYDFEVYGTDDGHGEDGGYTLYCTPPDASAASPKRMPRVFKEWSQTHPAPAHKK